MPPISKYTFKHNHWTASISSLGALAPHEFFKLEILVSFICRDNAYDSVDPAHEHVAMEMNPSYASVPTESRIRT